MKIFLTTGSSGIDYSGLIKRLDKVNRKNKYEICMQLGESEYIPKNARWIRFTNNIYEMYNWADLVVTHTGAGTLFELLKLNKKIISASNYNTVDNNELAEELYREGYIIFIPYYELFKLSENIENILMNKLKLKYFEFDKCNIEKYIIDFIG